MGKATTKAELLEAARTQYDAMWGLIDSLPDQNATFHFSPDFKGKEAHWARDKNLRDVLVHLHEWHRLLLDWVDANRKGDEKPFLPPPYKWTTYGQLNVEFWKKHQKTSLAQAKKMVRKSHENVVTLIEGFSNDELFTKNYFSWTGNNTLGSMGASATSSHYTWAIKKLKQVMKSTAQS